MAMKQTSARIEPRRRRPGIELVGAAFLAAACLAAMFLAAGTLRWKLGWLYVGVTGIGLVGHRLFVASRNPEVIRRRSEIGPGTRTWDIVWLAVFWPLMMSVPVVAGIATVRLGQHLMPAWVAIPGVAMLASGMIVSAASMVANRFFEGMARIQADQRVVDRGPYAVVRHPGYAGLALWALSGPMLLRSTAAFVPALDAAGWVVIRTVLEDRMLRVELPGYAEYARRVRHRLVPRFW
jgi:protein-S-isoprenylcysteine O-methyltransferase Ste14